MKVTLEFALDALRAMPDATLDEVVERNTGGTGHLDEVRLLIEDAITLAVELKTQPPNPDSVPTNNEGTSK